MSPTKFKSPSVYNPAMQSAEEIVSNFVIRLREFDELLKEIKNDDMKTPPQHFLIQGQRGYGKTTLLLRLNLAIRSDPNLNSWLIPLLFDEEQYGVHTLAKLWEKVIDMLEDQEQSFQRISDQIDSLYDTESPEEKIFNRLTLALMQSRKKVVLLIDNFGEIIEKFTKRENQRLREVLITSDLLRIIGTSSTILEFYYNYKEPLFDFFKVIMLPELTRDETILLLKRLDENYAAGEIDQILETHPERIDAIRKLTGGVPRTIVLLFEIFVDDVDGSSFQDLEMILDRVTPLYKHRMENLFPQQQSIIAAIAQNWDAVSTKDIAKAVRMPSKAVSSQLNQLEKNQLVEKITTSTKNHLYQIKERFFNIYYLMRLGKRKNRDRVLWLVKFFEIWCCQKELADRTQRHIDALRKGMLYDKHAYFVSQALAKTQIPLELQHELVTETRKFLTSRKSEYAKELDDSRRELFLESVDDIKKERFESATKKLRNLGIAQTKIALICGDVLRSENKDLKKAAEFYLQASKDGDADAMYNLANLMREEFKDFEKAKEYYQMVVEKGHVPAMYNLATLLWKEFKDMEKAKEYYQMVVEKGHVPAMYNLATLLWEEFKDIEKAKEYYQMAVEKGDVDAMYSMANLMREEFKDMEKAKEYYQMAVDKGHVYAMNNLANLMWEEFKDMEKAKEYYQMAVEKGDGGAMNNLANLMWEEFKDMKKAKGYYQMAVEKGNVSAMNNLANLLWKEFKEIEKAKEYYQMAVDEGHVYAMNNLANLMWEEFKDMEKAKEYYQMAVEKGHVKAMNNLANLMREEFKDMEKAKEYYQMAVDKGHVGAMNNLAWLFFEQKENKTKALKIQTEAYKLSQDINCATTFIYILLWNDKIDEAMEVFQKAFDNPEVQQTVNPLIGSILIAFLAKKQLNYVYRIFQENKYEIKDKYKPIYYALLSLLGSEYQDEFKKMGSELKETVQEVLNEIEKTAEQIK